MSPIEVGTRPSPGQMLLLRAALEPPAEAAAAWREWRRSVEFDEAGWGQFQLLPLVAENLPEAEMDAEVAGRIAGLQRMTWTRNQLLFHAAGEAASSLRDAGMTPLIIKGALLAQSAYRNLGIRPMVDVDLLVPLARAAEAISVLQRDGWSTHYPDPAARIGVHHSMAMSRGSGELDLHWQSLWLAADDAHLWETAVPARLGSVEVDAASPADNLLIVCAHGLPWSEEPNVRWIADAMTLIRTADPGVDWPRLRSEARRRRLSGWAAVALRYLRDEFGAEVPAGVLTDLESDPQSKTERQGLVAAMRPDSPLRTYRMARDRHARLRTVDPAGAPERFWDFARDFWGVERTAHLPLHALKRLRRAAAVRGARGSARSAS